MIVNAQIKTYSTEWKGVTDEQYAELRKIIPTLPIDKKNEYGGDHLCDWEALRKLAELGLDCEVTAAKQTHNTMITRLLGNRQPMPEACISGQVVQIHIPNLSLMSINQVDVLENACTDTVQEKLSEGWYLIAVCPPNSQRRPDYIIGRSRP